MTSNEAFQILTTEGGAPYIFVAAEHKLVVRAILQRDGIQAMCEVAIRDAKNNLPSEYSFTFATKADAEVAVKALEAAPEPD